MTTQPAPAKTKDEAKVFPEAVYYSNRISKSGHQPVYKKLLPDGETTELPLWSSQKLSFHSPEFNYGYSGSGPSQLSLALLLDATTVPETALSFYQYFKDDMVSKWGDKWAISRSEILLWIAKEQKRQIEVAVNSN